MSCCDLWSRASAASVDVRSPSGAGADEELASPNVEEALGWGLIDRIVDPADLLAEAQALAAPVLGATAEHVAAVKGLIR